MTEAQTTGPTAADGRSHGVRTEVGRLRTVLLHRPGPELSRLTPRNSADLLFDGLPWVARAQEEHDGFAQALRDRGVEVLHLSTLLQETLESPQGRADAVDAAVAQLEQDIRNLRSLITELRPAALDDLGVRAAITSLADRLEAGTGARVEAQVDDLGTLPPELEITVYRVVQEALTNASRPAGARTLEVRVRRHEGQVRLRVRDDGHGFDPQHPTPGFGLVGIRDRVALAGGRLELSSAPGAGTDLRAFLPVPAPASAPGLEQPVVQPVADELGT